MSLHQEKFLNYLLVAVRRNTLYCKNYNKDNTVTNLKIFWNAFFEFSKMQSAFSNPMNFSDYSFSTAFLISLALLLLSSCYKKTNFYGSLFGHICCYVLEVSKITFVFLFNIFATKDVLNATKFITKLK